MLKRFETPVESAIQMLLYYYYGKFPFFVISEVEINEQRKRESEKEKKQLVGRQGGGV